MENEYILLNTYIQLDKLFIDNSFLFYIENSYNNIDDMILLKDFYNNHRTYE